MTNPSTNPLQFVSIQKAHLAFIEAKNIDTDIIIPKQYLKSIERVGFGQYLFDDWRYLESAELSGDTKNSQKRKINPDFILNQSPYNQAQVLLVGDNFGCGSSREHAAWAIKEFGISAVIAPSFADIFKSNALKNGILPIVLAEEKIAALFAQAKRRYPKKEAIEISIDLENQTIKTNVVGLERVAFEVDENSKHRLLTGEDDIDQTLKQASEIQSFLDQYQKDFEWIQLNHPH